MNKEKYKAKFAEKLMSHQVMIPQVFTAGYDMIDEICSDYESRTCENCKWYVHKYAECDNIDNEIMYHSDYGVPKDYSCPMFKRIQDGL